MKPVDSLTFEQALEELEHIVRRLESGAPGLDSSMQDYERGMLLKSYCEKKLKDATLRVERITQEGGIKTEPFCPA